MTGAGGGSPPPVRRRSSTLLAGLFLLSPVPVLCAIVPSPASLTLAPGQTSSPIVATITFPAPVFAPDGQILGVYFSGTLSDWATTIPWPVGYTTPLGATSSTATFRIAVNPGASPGLYSVELSDASGTGGGSGVLSLRILRPTASLLPGSVSVVQGATSSPVTLQVANLGDSTLAFSASSPAALAGRVALQPGTVSISIPAGAVGGSGSFQVATSADAPPGVYGLPLSEPTFGLAATLRLEVLPSPITASLSPAAVSVAPGLDSGPIELRLGGAASGSFSFRATVPAALRGSVSTLPDPIRLAVPAGMSAASRTFQVRVLPSAPPGRYALPLTDSERGLTVILTLVVERPRLEAIIQPVRAFVDQGSSSAPLSLQVSGTNLGGRTLEFRPRFPAALSGSVALDPASVLIPLAPGSPGGSAAFRVSASPGAPPGIYSAALVEATYGFEAAFSIEIRIPVRVAAVAPEVVSVGSLAVPLRLTGENFSPGARVVSPSPLLLFGATRVVSAGSAETTVTVRGDAPPGRYPVRLVNPDGRAGEAELAIVAPGSLAAPLAVRSAAVVHPSPGAVIAAGDAVRPRGLLSTAGTGTIVGAWTLDGQVFDRFVVTSRGGLPVGVEARLPMPTTLLGEHQLRLVVETPQELVSPPVEVVVATARASTPRLHAPRAGAIVAATGALFRWTTVAGADGYEVEFLRAPPLPSMRFQAAAPAWRPGDAQLERLGSGVHRWRVRPLFPGGVLGEPTAARRVVVLPGRVELRIIAPAPGSPEVAWEGGAPGLLYRVDVESPASSERLFSALTSTTAYRFPMSHRVALPALQLQVTALAPGGIEIGRSKPAIVETSGAPGTSRAAAVFRPTILAVAPAADSIAESAHPTIRADWDAAVPPEQISLVVDEFEISALAEIEPTSISYRSLLRLEPGEHSVHLVVGDTLRSWTFRVREEEAETAEPEPAEAEPEWSEAPPPADSWSDWALSIEGTVSLITADDLPQDQVTASSSLSLQLDADGGTFHARAGGDAAVTEVLDGQDQPSQKQRSWTATFGAEEGRFRQEATIGYSPPEFLFGSELVTAGLARGGVGVSLAGPAAKLSVYESFDPDLAGVTSGSFGLEQEIRAGALELAPSSGRFSLRAVGLEVEEADGAFSFGGEGTVLGLLGHVEIGTGQRLEFEAASGEFTPNPGSLETRREGEAFRLGLSGVLGTLTYSVGFRLTDEGFVNPANRGLTAGGVSDRTGADLSLGKSWGSSSLSFTYRHLESGSRTSLASDDARQDAAEISYTTQLGEVVSVHLAGQGAATRSDGDPVLKIPGTDQLDWGGSAQLTETFGATSLSQSFSVQRSEDDLDPSRFSQVIDLSVSLSRTASSRFSLFALAGSTRTEQAALFGTTDALIAVLQPTLSFSEAGLSFQSYLSFNRSENDVSGSDLETESYQLSVTWTPPRTRGHLGLQAGTDWSRSRGPGLPDEGFARRYTSSLILRWDRSSGGPGATPSPTVGAPPASGPPPSPIGAYPGTS